MDPFRVYLVLWTNFPICWCTSFLVVPLIYPFPASLMLLWSSSDYLVLWPNWSIFFWCSTSFCDPIDLSLFGTLAFAIQLIYPFLIYLILCPSWSILFWCSSWSVVFANLSRVTSAINKSMARRRDGWMYAKVRVTRGIRRPDADVVIDARGVQMARAKIGSAAGNGDIVTVNVSRTLSPWMARPNLSLAHTDASIFTCPAWLNDLRFVAEFNKITRHTM